jgi:NTE family protein
MKLGIALGGGGAKGLTHIGVLSVLEKNGVKPTHVAGTSIGAVVGALYCLDGTADRLKERAQEMLSSDEFRDFGLDEFYTKDKNVFEQFKKEVFEKFYFGRLFFRKSHIKTKAARKLFDNMFGSLTFADLKTKLICNSLDIQTGEEVIFSSGKLSDAVWASCAIPGILPPCTAQGKILVDGGVVDNLPVHPLICAGAGIVIASYLGARPVFEGIPDTGFRINQRAQSFVRYHLDQNLIKNADCVIAPDVGDYHWADFSQLDTLVKKGEAATEKSMKCIRKVHSVWYRIRKHFV